jgi:hypothetical protein
MAFHQAWVSSDFPCARFILIAARYWPALSCTQLERSDLTKAKAVLAESNQLMCGPVGYQVNYLVVAEE